MNPMDRAASGFATLGVAEAFTRSALQHLGRWLEDEALSAYRGQILAMIDGGRWDLLLDCFYQVIPFGTGGRRGPVGVGPNRINPYTIATSIQGHCAYLKARREGALSVVVAYDVRRFQDARGHYDPSQPNPVLGLSSRDFAEIAAGVYAANGVTVHMLARGSSAYLSTPELSFAIRYLGADGGLNVSASHNPADDNGAKIYNHLGGQEIPPHDEALADEVLRVTEVASLGYPAAVEAGLVRALTDDVHAGYIAENLSLSLAPKARSARVVFTNLHGTADTTVLEVLRAAGFDVTLEPVAAEHDGSFPHVPFGIPNPEVPQSMDRAVALADEVGADLVMSCDPDADRLGVVARHGGGWRFLTGNEMAALTVHHGLVRRRAVGRRPIVIKTEVTSSLVSRVARHHGAQVVGHLLVGFKYIGEGLRLLDDVGGFYSAEGTLEDFVAGVEESHGVLVSTEIRDKDAAGGAVWLAEAASLAKAEGRTLVDVLEQIWRDVGYVRNTLVSTVMRGATGRDRIVKIQTAMRAAPPRRIGGRKVLAFHDRADAQGPFGRIRSGTDAASRDVLVFELEGDARLILRPSGTEPKNKVYAEVALPPRDDVAEAVQEADAICDELARSFVGLMLQQVGIDLPPWAITVSDLVPVERKQHFADELMPGLAQRLSEGEAVEPWLDDQLAPYGRDGRVLVRAGVRAWIGATAPTDGVADALRGLFAL